MFKPLSLKAIVMSQMLTHMALVKFGGGVAAVSGKVAGTVYARNATGSYARNWAKPINPGTPRQTDVRSFFAGASAEYSMLSLGQVAAWDAYAAQLTRVNRQGESYTPTGRQMYIETYSNMVAVGLGALGLPSAFSNVPAINSLGAIVALSSAGEIDTLTLDTSAFTIPSGDDGWLIIEAAPAHKPSVRNVNTQYRQIFTTDLTGVTYPIDLAPGFIAVFGNSFVTGQVFSLRARVIDGVSGLGSTRMIANAAIISA